ncbi:YdcF family protein [Rhabdothermincola sp.]|uniref:YdcF family protein n=1 Tax=Rhabdothermincola sp. TaxID=2820405 RepID=UPI002FE061E5
MLRWTVRIALGLLAALVVYVGVTFGQVWWASRQDHRRPASAIIVMGAAQWDGRPSPVLRARLDHAAELWEQGLAGHIIVTGGKQQGDRVTQGFAGYDYLRGKGVPEEVLKVEVEGRDSYQELSASAAIVRAAGLEPEVLVVTDPYHALRASQIAHEVGLEAAVSPTASRSPLSALGRETVAVSIGRLIGYRRLSNLG